MGGLESVKSTCGWIGPVPAPSGIKPGWVALSARQINFTRPVVDDLRESSLEIIGFSDSELRSETDIVQELSDPSKWAPPQALPRRAAEASEVKLDAIRLKELETTSQTPPHRAILDLTSHGTKVSFTLYTNPVFVHVPKCDGNLHPIHERRVRKLLNGRILAKDLKDGAAIPSEGLIIIDATQPSEELLARAWCAETGRHALVRKAQSGCFTCATDLAAKRTGLAFNVLIWCL
jgi:hypothetical protein